MQIANIQYRNPNQQGLIKKLSRIMRNMESVLHPANNINDLAIVFNRLGVHSVSNVTIALAYI